MKPYHIEIIVNTLRKEDIVIDTLIVCDTDLNAVINKATEALKKVSVNAKNLLDLKLVIRKGKTIYDIK